MIFPQQSLTNLRLCGQDFTLQAADQSFELGYLRLGGAEVISILVRLGMHLVKLVQADK